MKLMSQEEIDSNMSFFCQILDNDPENIDALGGLAMSYLMAKKFSESRQTANKILDIDPKNKDAREILSNLYALERLNSTNTLSKKERKNAEREYKKGAKAYQDKEYDKAKEYFNNALRIDPYNVDVEQKLALVFFQQAIILDREDNSIDSINSIEQAIKLDPQNTNYWMILGSFYGKQEKYKATQHAYRKALELDPSNERVIEVLSNLEPLLEANGNDEKADAREDDLLNRIDNAFRVD